MIFVLLLQQLPRCYISFISKSASVHLPMYKYNRYYKTEETNERKKNKLPMFLIGVKSSNSTAIEVALKSYVYDRRPLTVKAGRWGMVLLKSSTSQQKLYPMSMRSGCHLSQSKSGLLRQRSVQNVNARTSSSVQQGLLMLTKAVPRRLASSYTTCRCYIR